MRMLFKRRSIIVYLLLGGIVVGAILYHTYKNTQNLISAAAWIEHTQEVLLESHEVANNVTSGDKKLVAEQLERLRQLVGDNHTQIVKVDSLKKGLAISDSNTFMRLLADFEREEYHLLKIRRQASNESVRGFEETLAGLVIILMMLAAVIIVSVRQGEVLRAKVTERNDVLERTLKEVSDFKYALDESSIVAITDQRGIIKHVNDNFCKISKYSREELIGKDHRIINSSYHSKEFISNIWQTISHGKIWKGELRNMAKDGTIYWVDTSIVPFLNDQRKPYQYLAIRSDITERKIVQAELSDLLDRITEGFVVVDHNMNYTYVNKRFSEMSSLDPKAILGRSVWDVFPEALNSPTYHAFQEAIKEQHVVTSMDYYPPIDLWYESHIYPTDKGLSVFVRDVTKQMRAERKLLESERLYRSIASSIPGSVICLIDKDYRYLLIEGDMLEKVGYSKSALLGRRAIDALPEDLYKGIEPLFGRVLKGEAFSTESNRKDYDLFTRYVPLRNEHGDIYAAMIVAIDVTDMKLAERKIAELNTGLEKKITQRTAQLEAANHELESFSYSVAHDLRSPLRAVSGYTSMFTEDYRDKVDDEGKRILSEIEYNAAKMGTLIDDLLTFSRLGRKEVRKSPVDMKAVFSSAIKDLSIEKVDIRLHDIKPVFGDFSLVKHVVVNLVSNAVKYSSKKEHPVVKISSTQDQNIVTYSIADNGVGFDMQYADKLFGVFQRLHSNEEFEGTGVGLAIVQRIINRHGGRVWFHSKVDEGATFCFSLPAVSPEQS